LLDPAGHHTQVVQFMSRISRTLLSPLLVIAIGGCTGISFKQGAGGDELRRAEAECRSTTSERNAFSQCMEAKGWWSRSMEELSQMGFVPVDEDAHDEGETTSAATDAAAVTSAVATTPVATPADKHSSPAAKSSAGAASAKAAIPKDPLSRITIAMWAKAGADGSALQRSQAACADTLGAGHEPDPVAKTVTRGLYDCLRKDGWVGMTLR